MEIKKLNSQKQRKMCKKIGIEVDEVSIDRTLLNASYSVYRVIHSAEASSNMSNLTGIIFGPRGEGDNYIEMIKDHRTKGFSPLIIALVVIVLPSVFESLIYMKIFTLLAYALVIAYVLLGIVYFFVSVRKSESALL